MAAINSERLNLVAGLIDQAEEFINQVYIPDVLAIASFYKDWTKYGGGLSNYLCYGEFPTKGYGDPDSFKYSARRSAGTRFEHGASGECAR